MYSKTVISRSNKYIYNIQSQGWESPQQNIKILISDRGEKYESNKFSKLCANFDIIYQTTILYTPQQNKIAERKNKTLKVMVNSILISSESPRTCGGKPY